MVTEAQAMQYLALPLKKVLPGCSGGALPAGRGASGRAASLALGGLRLRKGGNGE